ncbi:MAG: CpsB/CapC family capsule biosynthesis tyrosine phosphatase [Bryobacteraceae bacterium]
MDDGARSFEESLAMVRMAAESGTTDIVATPHANLEYSFDPDLIGERILALEEAIRTAGEPGPRIHRGCDFHLAYDNVQDAVAHPGKYTINHGRYLLVEFSNLAIFHTTTEIFDRLLNAGMVPVITHPERNPLLQQRLPQLRQWAEMGVLLQVTAGSLLGSFGSRAREFSETLLAENLVHCIASDAHDTERRTPRLDEAREWIEKRYNAALAQALTAGNPGAMIANEPLPAPCDPPKPKKWYRFWG